MNKNNVNVSSIPLVRPSVSVYQSVNLPVISSFEYARNDIKITIAKASISIVLSLKKQRQINPFDKQILDNYLDTLAPMLTTLG